MSHKASSNYRWEAGAQWEINLPLVVARLEDLINHLVQIASCSKPVDLKAVDLTQQPI